MDNLKITITYALKIYLTSIISIVISTMIYFLGYSVFIVILEGLFGSDSSIQTWVGAVSGILALVVFIAVWISLFYLGKTWQVSLNIAVKLLIGLLGFITALITIFLFAVYLAGLS